MAKSFGRVTAAAVLLLSVLWFPAVGWAQPAASGSSRTTYPLGYGFAGFGAATGGGESEATLHVGGGGEAVFLDAIGVGAEIGYLMPFSAMGDGIGVFSVNGTYHFLPNEKRKLRPFVTAGYTLGFRDGHENLFNFGGGVHYWFKPKTALRVEFRDHVWSSGDTLHFWSFRVGVAIR